MPSMRWRTFISAARKGKQLAISIGLGLLSGGAQRQTALIYTSFRVNPSSLFDEEGWLANPARCSAAYKKLPDESPVNMRPVRFEPCAPGASPTTNRRAWWSPNPGTGLPQYSQSRYALRRFRATSSRQATSRGHLRHWITSLSWFSQLIITKSAWHPQKRRNDSLLAWRHHRRAEWSPCRQMR